MYANERKIRRTMLLLVATAFLALGLGASVMFVNDIEEASATGSNIDVQVGDFTYDFNINTATVKGLSADGMSKNSVTIPASVVYSSDTYAVVSINSYAFSDNATLTSVTIEGGVSISTGAFSNCTSLISIALPDTTSVVASGSFSGCTSLNSLVLFGNSVTDYTDVINLLPETITSVAFDSTAQVSLESIASIERITKIGIVDSTATHDISGLTFKDMSGTTITDPEDIEGNVFEAESRTVWIQIATIEPSDPNVRYQVNREDMTAQVIGLYDNTAAGAIIDGYFISEGAAFEVTSIADNAFSGYTSLASVTIPDSVTSIGSSAFSGCTSLAAVTLPDDITSISSGTFNDCSSLTGITIPDGVTSIGDGAFTGCYALTSVTMPDGIDMEITAFSGCTALTHVMVKGDTSSTVTDYTGILTVFPALTTVIVDSPAAVDLSKISAFTTVTKIVLTQNTVASTELTLMMDDEEVTGADRAAMVYITTDVSRIIWNGTPTVAIPTAITGLTYNALPQIGVPYGYSYEYSIADNEGTNVGTYTATAVLTTSVPDAFWSDGTKSNKTVTWSIA
ncbi:MAG: leucine-rich repeat domain-containing protein, partial [Candidatus Methanomethylophilaceae archaeon]